MEAILIWIVIAGFTAAVASSKGRSGFGWFILGCFFSLIALIAVAIMPKVQKGQDEPAPETHVRCPDCRELVRNDARKCKHCGCALIPVEEQK